MRSKRSIQVAIKARVIIFHKIFLSGCYECLHVQWLVINSVSSAMLMSYNSLKSRLPLQYVSAEGCIPCVLSRTKESVCVSIFPLYCFSKNVLSDTHDLNFPVFNLLFKLKPFLYRSNQTCHCCVCSNNIYLLLLTISIVVLCNKIYNSMELTYFALV